MSVFSASFSGVTVNAAQDLFEIVAPADSRIAMREIRLGQSSDAGDAQAEGIRLTVFRGHTTTGSSGNTVTPVNRQGHTGAVTSTTTVKINNTGLAAGGSPVLVLADVWNVQIPYLWVPDADERITLPAGGRCVVRITAPADEIIVSGTIVFEELGQ